MSDQWIALLASDSAFRRRLRGTLEGLGWEVVETADPLAGASEPAAIVLELERPGAVSDIAEWKRRWSKCFVAGAIGVPDQELWIGATAAGCDLVANRGAFPRQLERQLSALRAGTGGVSRPRLRLRAKPVKNPGDGLVGRLPDAPDGSIVVFRVGSRLCAVRDSCPHAGASLADGKLDGTVVTCPAHGSQFDVGTGERLRGPSDFPIRIYRAVMEGEDIYVEV